jgi:hypothetical protein
VDLDAVDAATNGLEENPISIAKTMTGLVWETTNRTAAQPRSAWR